MKQTRARKTHREPEDVKKLGRLLSMTAAVKRKTKLSYKEIVGLIVNHFHQGGDPYAVV